MEPLWRSEPLPNVGPMTWDEKRRRGRLAWPKTILAMLVVAAGCGSSTPVISDVSVNPSTVQLSGIVNTETFVVSCSVLHFGGSITSVSASVENQNVAVAMAKTGGVLGDEQWSGSVQLTLFTGFSAGTYQVDIQAIDSNGASVTQKAAATVTVTQ